MVARCREKSATLSLRSCLPMWLTSSEQPGKSRPDSPACS